MTQKENLSRISSFHSYAEGFNGVFAKYRIRKLDEFRLSGSVLDVGCGEGQITGHLLEKFERVVAIEPAVRPCALTKLKFPDLEIYNTTLEEYDSEEGFDVVLAMGVLEHVPDPKVFLSQVRKHLKTGGRFVMTAPNGEALHRRIGIKMGLIQSYGELDDLDRKVGHYRYYDFTSLRNEIEDAGFDIETMTGIFVKPFPFSMVEKLDEGYREALYKLSWDLPNLCAEIFLIAH